MTEKEEPTLISAEKVKRLCKCRSKKPSLKLHTKGVFSDGWTRCARAPCASFPCLARLPMLDDMEVREDIHSSYSGHSNGRNGLVWYR